MIYGQDGSLDKGVQNEQSSRKPCGKPRLEVKPKQQVGYCQLFVKQLDVKCNEKINAAAK